MHTTLLTHNTRKKLAFDFDATLAHHRADTPPTHSKRFDLSRRYPLKKCNDPEKLHLLEMPWVCGGMTRQRLEESLAEYRLKSGNANRKRTPIENCTYMDRMGEYYDKNVYPLNLHMAQIVRLMINSGRYKIGSKMMTPGAFDSVSDQLQ